MSEKEQKPDVPLTETEKEALLEKLVHYTRMGNPDDPADADKPANIIKILADQKEFGGNERAVQDEVDRRVKSKEEHPED